MKTMKMKYMKPVAEAVLPLLDDLMLPGNVTGASNNGPGGPWRSANGAGNGLWDEDDEDGFGEGGKLWEDHQER